MSKAQEKLFEAFLAGFEASGEGFNGEYRHEQYCGSYEDSEGGRRFVARMRGQFENWLSETGDPTSLPASSSLARPDGQNE